MLVVVGVPQGATAHERAELVWGPCEKESKPGNPPALAGLADGEVECATLRVPLDYRNPQQTIGIALNRIKGKVSRDHNHLGVLLVNPGGPGASGRGLAKTVAAAFPVTWPTAST
ncbi:hypothetical protein ACFQX6_29150 [Streptosporangium lutulentum]